jgi:alkylation response protein AidB-like acyl-CoA dehydrogenase
MDLEYGERYEKFRQEVRAFLDDHEPPPPGKWKRRDRIRWLTLQIEHGYWARTIPKQYGGFGAAPDLLETVIMDEEFNRAGVTRGMPAQGPAMLVPTLLEHGSEEQKRRWIGPTMRGEVLWCQGYSEPGAGSDLASLQTSAREEGDDFVINGQKIWTSTADKAHRTMSGDLGENSFNQVFFQDVRVPQTNVVGRRGEGWKIANTTLKHERNSLNANPEGTWLRLARLMQNETVDGAPAMANPVHRDRLLELQGRTLAMKFHGMRMLTCSLKNEPPGVAGLVAKLQNCQLNFDLAALALDVMGELGALYDHAPHEREHGFWQTHSIFSLGLIIGGGTAQIQKNIIAERGLGMPREPKPAKG